MILENNATITARTVPIAEIHCGAISYHSMAIINYKAVILSEDGLLSGTLKNEHMFVSQITYVTTPYEHMFVSQITYVHFLGSFSNTNHTDSWTSQAAKPSGTNYFLSSSLLLISTLSGLKNTFSAVFKSTFWIFASRVSTAGTISSIMLPIPSSI